MKFQIILLTLIVLFNTITGQYAGESIKILTMDKEIYDTVTAHIIEFTEQTGANVTVTSVSRSDLYEEALSDVKGAGIYDGFILSPQWLVDFVDCERDCEKPYLKSLTEWVKESNTIQWADISTFFRDFSAYYAGDIYNIPLDGDLHFMYYRKDILEEYNLPIPKTWIEYVNTAKELHGRDFNNDSVPDFGSCISWTKEVAAFFAMDFIAPFLQSKGSQQGTFFDLETMEPLFNNEAFVEAMELMREAIKYGAPASTTVEDYRVLFPEGRCALGIDWGNQFSNANNSNYAEFIAGGTAPGTSRVWDRNTNSMKQCDENLCPFAKNGINIAPYAAFGGWSGSVSNLISEKQQEITFKFLSFVSTKSSSDIVTGKGFDPYRKSHLQHSLWRNAGFSTELVDSIVTGLDSVLENQNIALDIRIPSNSIYQEKLLNSATFDYLNGNLTTKQFQTRIVNEWNSLTDKLDRFKQTNYYRQSLGLNTLKMYYYYEVSEEIIAFVIAVAGVFGFACIPGMILLFILRNGQVIRVSSYYFCQTIMFGSLCVFASVVFMSLESSIVNCTTSFWLLMVGLGIVYLSLIAKNFRIWFIFKSAKKFKVSFITNWELAKIILSGLAPLVIFLAVWTLVFGFHVNESSEGLEDQFLMQKCSSDHSNILITILVGYFMLIFLVGAFLSFQLKSVMKSLNESFHIAICLYNVVFVSTIAILISLTTQNPIGHYLVQSFSIIWSTSFTAVAIFGPKFYYAFLRREFAIAYDETSKSTEMSRRTKTSSSDSEEVVTTKKKQSKAESVEQIESQPEEEPTEQIEELYNSLSQPEAKRLLSRLRSTYNEKKESQRALRESLLDNTEA